MKRFCLFLIATIFLFLLAPNSKAAICKKEYMASIQMDDGWYKKEKKRLENEDILLDKYSNYISKKTKPLVAEIYHCNKINNYQLIASFQKKLSPKTPPHKPEFSNLIIIGIILSNLADNDRIW